MEYQQLMRVQGASRPDMVIFSGASDSTGTTGLNAQVADIKTGNAQFSNKQQTKNQNNLNGFQGYTISGQDPIRPKH